MKRLRESILQLFHTQSIIRHILTLLTGTTLAQVLTIPLIPILTRIYTPHLFGILAIYVSVVSVISVLATWRYDLAIPLPESDSEAADLMAIAVILSSICALVILVVFALLKHQIASLLGEPDIAPWLLLVPLSVLLTGISGALGYWAMRMKSFYTISLAGIINSVGTTATQVLIAVASAATISGLLVGQILGTSLATIALANQSARLELRESLRLSHLSRLKATAAKYHQLPLHTLTTSFLNTVSSSALPLVLSGAFGPYVAGLTMLAQRMLMYPLSIVSQSIWKVAHAELGLMESDKQVALLRRVSKSSAYLFAFPLGAVSILSSFSGAVFGERWQNLSMILPSIAVMAFISSVSGSLSYFAAFRRYRAETITNIILCIVRLGTLVIGPMMLGRYAAVNLYSLASSLVYLGIITYWGITLGTGKWFARDIISSIILTVMLLIPAAFYVNRSPFVALGLTCLAGALYYYICTRILLDGRISWLKLKSS